MSLNFDLADKMIGVGSAKRQEMDKAGRFGRSAALAEESNGPEKAPQPRKPASKNLVKQEMQAKKDESAHHRVFDQVSQAFSAAQSACQKELEGVQSKKQRDAVLTKCLNDLIDVIESIRDDRKEIIASLSDEERSHSILLP
jgi:hypothetical protein